MKTTLLSLAVVAVAGVPGVASAATVSSDGTTAVYRAANREANTLSLTTSVPLTLADLRAPLDAGPGCLPGAGGTVACSAANLQAFLGDRADSASVNDQVGDVTIDGGSGDDAVTAGSISRVTVTGGSGDDTLRLNANALGAADGGSGDDEIAGTSGGNALAGGDGSDLLTDIQSFGSASLDGGDGADRLVGDPDATLTGGSGGDLLVVAPGGSATLDGGPGSDRITSPGGAAITAGPGNDLVDASDGSGTPDTISCGSGWDVVWADPGDSVAPDCELRRSGSAPGLPGTAQAIADAAALIS
jgi:Ca2+-binding RTX toxin-like protein